MRLLLRAFCLLATASCSANRDTYPVSQQAAPFQSYDITAGLQCEPESGLLGCLRAHERVDAHSKNSAVTRRGERLCLRIQSMPTCFDDGGGLAYAFLGQVGPQNIVVEADATGGYAVVLVNASSGSQRRVDNKPLFSSDPNLFATVSYDTDAGYLPNRVAIWSVDQPHPVYEFGSFSRGEGPTGIRWLGPSRLEVRYSREPFSPDHDDTDTFSIWRDQQGIWKNNYKQ